MIMDYRTYKFTKREFVLYLTRGMVLYGVIAYLFYRNLFCVLIGMGLSVFYLEKVRTRQLEKRKWELNIQFRDGILGLTNALNAGYSIENAFQEAGRELSFLYGTEAYIVREFQYITAQLGMNCTVEEALYDFGCRSGVEDIRSFAEIFVTAKRTGGDIMGIIHRTGKNIGDKLLIKREIKTLAAAKQLEAKIMEVIPFGILIYLMVFSPGFLDPLYHNMLGTFVMTGGLLLYWGAVSLAEKIMNIEV